MCASSYLHVHTHIPHRLCGFGAHTPSPRFAVPICIPLPWEMWMLQVYMCPCCSLQPSMYTWGRNPHQLTYAHPSLLLATTSCPLLTSCGLFMVSQGRMLNLAWAGRWCYGAASVRTKPDFDCFSIYFCLSLTHCSSLLLKKRGGFDTFFQADFLFQKSFCN